MQNNDVQRYFPQRVYSIDRIPHEGNNTLFDVQTESGRYVFKKYFGHYESWQRGISEFHALSFLWKKGFRDIPKPVEFHEPDIGIYGFCYGKPILGKEVVEEDIKRGASFLAKLHNLDEGKEEFGPASSACLCLGDYVHVIDRRYERILGFINETTPERIRSFILNDVKNKIEDIKREFKKNSRGMDLEAKLSMAQQVLTPADFGFHNVLRAEDYCFIDFEYFGRDDPARQILDFMHHGSSRGISPQMKELFLAEYLSQVNPNQRISLDRLGVIEPLTKMTWILICLNAVNQNYNPHLDNRRELAEKRIQEAEERLGEINE